MPSRRAFAPRTREHESTFANKQRLLTVLCQFANGAEGVLEFSGIDALAAGDRLEVYGDLGTMSYDFGSDAINVTFYGFQTEFPNALRETILRRLRARLGS